LCVRGDRLKMMHYGALMINVSNKDAWSNAAVDVDTSSVLARIASDAFTKGRAMKRGRRDLPDPRSES